MHLLNPRFLPGGRKKLRDGLEAHNTILLFLQDYIDFTDQRKHKGKITFLGCGVPPHPLFWPGSKQGYTFWIASTFQKRT